MASPERKPAPAASGDEPKAKTIRIGVRTKHDTKVGDRAMPYLCAGHQFHQAEQQLDVAPEVLADLQKRDHVLLVRVLDGTDTVLPTAEKLMTAEKTIDGLREEVAALTEKLRRANAEIASIRDPEDEKANTAAAIPAMPSRPNPAVGLPRMG